MPRSARIKITDNEAWYHIYARVRGPERYYPLAEKELRRKMIQILQRYTDAYCCRLASFCVMGNHWHAVINFEAPRELNNDELLHKARILYPGREGRNLLSLWGADDWIRLKERLFDLSELMRNVNASFTRWYNRIYKTVGTFWADRFKSVVLADERSVLDCMLYVELNPVRAGLVTRPEDFEGSSAFLRCLGKDRELVSVREILNENDTRKAKTDYRYLLYHRGNIPSKKGQARIPDRIVEDEASRGFRKRGSFLKRMRHLRDGVILGSKDHIREQLSSLRETGRYLRRKNPISHCDGLHHTLREQRSHARI